MNPQERPLSDLTFVCFDTETTGLSSENDRLVELAAIAFRMDGQVLGEFQTLIHQRLPIPPALTAIHGISTEMCEGAPVEASALVGFTYLLNTTRGTVMVAHNAPFDIGFVGMGLQRVGWPYPVAPVLCTQQVAKKTMPVQSLQKIAQHLQIDPGDAHRALSDCRTTMKFLLMMIERHCKPDDTLSDIPGAMLYTFAGEMAGKRQPRVQAGQGTLL